MNSLAILKDIAMENKGLILTRDAVAGGVSRASLSFLCKAGRITRVSVGQYVLPEDAVDEMLSIGVRSRHIIFSHESTLYLHGLLCDGVLLKPAVTIPASKTMSRFINRQCKVYRVRDEWHGLGRVQLPTARGNLVWAYDMERTICDIVRSRRRIAKEVFDFALARYMEGVEKDLEKLEDYAGKMGMERQMENICLLLRSGHDNLAVQGYISPALARNQGLRCNNSGVIHEIPEKTPEKQT